MDVERWSDWMPTVSAASWEERGDPDTGLGGIRRVLRTSVAQANSTIEELTDFRTQALPRLANQHDEIPQRRTAAAPKANIARLPAIRKKFIASC
jgi:hypothetical protein